jgi:hypothetical protein
MKSFVKFGLGTGSLVGLWNLSCFTIVSWVNEILSLNIPAAKIRAYSGLFGLIILILGIYFGMNELRKKQDRISYGAAVKTGISISLISAILVAFFGFLYCTVINPGYATYMVKETENVLIAAKKSPEEINQQLMKVRSFYSTSSQVLQALIVQSFAGIIGSLILGLFIRTKK